MTSELMKEQLLRRSGFSAPAVSLECRDSGLAEYFLTNSPIPLQAKAHAD